MSIPATGVPREETRANTAGNNPSLATARGSWPTINVQPLSVPKQEIAAPIATRPAAPDPNSRPAASANGAVDCASIAGGSTPITPVVLTM